MPAELTVEGSQRHDPPSVLYGEPVLRLWGGQSNLFVVSHGRTLQSVSQGHCAMDARHA